jgi:hypothetical protein
MKEMMWSRKSTVSSVESALQGARLGLLQWCKLWGQKLLDGLHALALIEMPPMEWNHRGHLQVAGDVVQLHARSPRVWDDNLGGVDGEQLGEGPGVGGAD